MDLFSNLQLLHEAAISVLVTTIYGRWRTITNTMQGRIQDFRWGDASLRHRCFSVKTYVKTKEFGPVGGGGAPETFVCRSTTVMSCNFD